MYKARDKVYWFAIFSRIFILLLQVIFNVICPDHNADAFHIPQDPAEKYSILDHTVTFIFKGLTRWDGQYYIHIAKYGYTYENTLAFFPLFPMSLRHIAMLLHIDPRILNYSNTIVIAGVIINFVCFIKAALILYDLSEIVFTNTNVAYRAAILFCINPASIFFTAIYTESMFAYLTYYSMLESLKNNPYIFLPLGLSNLVRSNGLINIGFPIYISLKNLLITDIPNFMSEYKYYHSNKKTFFFNARHILVSIFRIIFVIILSLIPFSFLQVYNYSKFCTAGLNMTLPYHIEQHALVNNLLLPGRHQFSWCKSKIPIAYSEIQIKYWNVGFLNYYQIKQIPNFVLAFPILYIMIKCCTEYFKEHKSKLLTLEFFTGIAQKKTSDNQKYPFKMFVFIIHGLFLTLFCILFVHIQVSTRLLCSASPLLYWYCALATLQKVKFSKSIKQIKYESKENLFSKWKVFFISQKQFSTIEKIIIGYFIGYYVVGCFMYSNYLPWT